MALSMVKWVNDLTLSIALKYNGRKKQINIPWRENFSALAQSHDKISPTRSDANFVTANMVFVLDKPCTKTGEFFVTVPVSVPSNSLLKFDDAFQTGEGVGIDKVVHGDGSTARFTSQTLVDRLTTRHNAGKQQSNVHVSELTKVPKLGPGYYSNVSDLITLQQKFHHSEQAFYEFLTQEPVIAWILKGLLNHGIEPGAQIKLIVLDMFSTRYVCDNCALGVNGLMNPTYKFLEVFSQLVKQSHIGINLDDVSVVPRVIAQRPGGTGSAVPAARHYDNKKLRSFSLEERLLPQKNIFSMDVNVAGLDETISPDLHRRTSFTSNKAVKAEEVQGHVIAEYADMIERGLSISPHARLPLPAPPKRKNAATMSTRNILQQMDAFTELAQLECMRTVDTQGTRPKHLARRLHTTRQGFEREIRDIHALQDRLLTLDIPISESSLLLEWPKYVKVCELYFDLLKDELVTLGQLFDVGDSEVLCALFHAQNIAKILDRFGSDYDLSDLVKLHREDRLDDSLAGDMLEDDGEDTDIEDHNDTLDTEDELETNDEQSTFSLGKLI
ncbi:MAG: hypothetical protein DHS20C10_10950 [marine bacterium B5-7]|nr:MAG: hypothetical protein DHS20C10_10950 [marine bacterium B5-7]